MTDAKPNQTKKIEEEKKERKEKEKKKTWKIYHFQRDRLGGGRMGWDGNAIKSGFDDHCITINVTKFIE